MTMVKKQVRQHTLYTAPLEQEEEKRSALCAFLQKSVTWGLGLLCLLVSVSFYTGTYDTALVKLTLLQLGGIVLVALWVCQLALEKRFIFTRQNIWLYAPFLAYFGWSLISYLWLPYKAEAFEEFIRYVIYFLLVLMTLSQFRVPSVQTVTKCIIAAAWICFLYGLVQVADRFVPGVDILPWRAFFGSRVFSTHANPNFFADFVVFSNFIILSHWLLTRKKSLLVLFSIGLIDLFFTESKGGWIGFAASSAFFVALYTNVFPSVFQKHIKKINTAACLLVLGVLILVGVYAGKRFQSVSFRAHTWLSTVQMISDSPVLGTGLGSFRIIYPAYRKAQIFYIENAHNNETQHPENELLEQWATVGTIGLAFFLWLVFFVFFTGIKNLIFLNKSLLGAGKKPAARSYLLLGYLAAFFGLLVHSVFDISIRFVSTGLFFAVFAAVIIVLARADELEKTESASCVADGAVHPLVPSSLTWAVWLAKLAVLALTIWLCGYLFYMFRETVGNLSSSQSFGSGFLRVVAWLVFGLTVLLAGWVYLKTAFLSKVLRVPLILLVSLCPLYYFYGYFQSDHYYGVAVEFVKRGLYDGALDYYQKAIEKNPLLAGYYQYRASLLRGNLDMAKVFSPKKGDTDGPMNDYERAVRDLSRVQQMAPNHSLLYQAWGELHYSAALMYSKLAAESKPGFELEENKAQAIKNMELAKQNFKHSLLLDPVNEMTYVHLISMAMMERDAKSAREYIDLYRRGPDGVTEEEYLLRNRQNAKIKQQEMALSVMPWATQK